MLGVVFSYGTLTSDEKCVLEGIVIPGYVCVL